jgi:hypothetical protein
METVLPNHDGTQSQTQDGGEQDGDRIGLRRIAATENAVPTVGLAARNQEAWIHHAGGSGLQLDFFGNEHLVWGTLKYAFGEKQAVSQSFGKG